MDPFFPAAMVRQYVLIFKDWSGFDPLGRRRRWFRLGCALAKPRDPLTRDTDLTEKNAKSAKNADYRLK
jgi:hypothetical protein